jgi:hypothetical protein
MRLTCRKIRLSKRLEVFTIVREQGFVLTDRIRQLLHIIVTELCPASCLTSWSRRVRLSLTPVWGLYGLTLLLLYPKSPSGSFIQCSICG